MTWRDQALVDLNLTLEQQFNQRTQALQAANAQLVIEQAVTESGPGNRS